MSSQLIFPVNFTAKPTINSTVNSIIKPTINSTVNSNIITRNIGDSDKDTITIMEWERSEESITDEEIEGATKSIKKSIFSQECFSSSQERNQFALAHHSEYEVTDIKDLLKILALK